MANEFQWKYGSEITLESTGAKNNAASFNAASTNFTGGSGGNSAAYPEIELEFSGTWENAPTAGEVVNIYARALNFEGTNDNRAPDANFPHRYVCSIPVYADTSAQYFKTSAVNPYPNDDATYYMENATSTTIAANWTLKVTARSPGPL